MTLQEWLHKEFGDDPSDGVMYSIPMYSKIWTAGRAAEREKYAKLIEAAEAAVNSCWRLDTDITEEIAELRDLLERMKNEN